MFFLEYVPFLKDLYAILVQNLLVYWGCDSNVGSLVFQKILQLLGRCSVYLNFKICCVCFKISRHCLKLQAHQSHFCVLGCVLIAPLPVFCCLICLFLTRFPFSVRHDSVPQFRKTSVFQPLGPQDTNT